MLKHMDICKNPRSGQLYLVINGALLSISTGSITDRDTVTDAYEVIGSLEGNGDSLLAMFEVIEDMKRGWQPISKTLDEEFLDLLRRDAK